MQKTDPVFASTAGEGYEVKRGGDQLGSEVERKKGKRVLGNETEESGGGRRVDEQK